MERIILEQLKNELVSGVKKRGHPFRYFTFGTVDAANRPQLRMVVLREVDHEFNLFFFTDTRSPKVIQIQNNEAVGALFYHPEKLIQLQLHGKAYLVEDKTHIMQFWATVPESSKKDYRTTNAPGSTLQNPSDVKYMTDYAHFSIIKIVPTSIAYLRLQQPDHIRVSFIRTKTDWKPNFLVP